MHDRPTFAKSIRSPYREAPMTNGINSALSGSHTLLPDDLSLEGELAADGTVGLGVGGFGLKL